MKNNQGYSNITNDDKVARSGEVMKNNRQIKIHTVANKGRVMSEILQGGDE